MVLSHRALVIAFAFFAVCVTFITAANVNLVGHYNGRFKYSDFKGEITRDVITEAQNATLTFTLANDSPFQFVVHGRINDPEIAAILVVDGDVEVVGVLKTIDVIIDDNQNIQYINGIEFIVTFPAGVATLPIKPSNWYVSQRIEPFSELAPSLVVNMLIIDGTSSSLTLVLPTPKLVGDYAIPPPSDKYDGTIVAVMCGSLAGCVLFYIAFKAIPFLFSRRANKKQTSSDDIIAQYNAQQQTQRKGSLELSPRQDMV